MRIIVFNAMINLMHHRVFSLLLFVALFIGNSLAQVTFRIAQLPASTPPDASIYLSGNFEGWSGGQEAYRLQKDADSLYFITLPQMVGMIQFKFTRGSWTSVEKGVNGEEIANRTYNFGGNGATVNITIHNWADLSGITSTAAENVSLMDDAFYMPQLNRTRKIWIYLPPDYESSQRFYPVMYMHDAQNLFDDSTSFAGEWGVDETLNDLYDETNFGLIVVGIENGGTQRINEYSPWYNPNYGGGQGEAYIEFIAETLKPYIDSAYRTIPDPEFTGLMGSSMGGLISEYGGIAEPEVFGRIGMFSSSFGLFDSCYTYTSDAGVDPESRFYFLAGGLEGNVVQTTQLMVDVLLSEGLPSDNIQMVVDPQGMHNEGFWRREFGDAVEWLFDVTSEVHDENSKGSIDVKIFPNPVSEVLHIVPEDVLSEFKLELFDAKGMLLIRNDFRAMHLLDVTKLSSGIYTLRMFSGQGYQVEKIVVE